MTIKNIKVFVAVFREESITRAARKLEITQPAVSSAIRELEEHFDTKLFERSGRGIRPTEAAQHFYSNAIRLLSLYEETDTKMKNWNTMGKLRIGSSVSIGAVIMPQLVTEFSKKYPDLDTYIKVDCSEVLEKYIEDSYLDFALIGGNVRSDRICSRVFLEDELLPICSTTHSLAGKSDVTLERLRNESFLLREKNSETRAKIDSLFVSHHMELKPLWESSSTMAIINAVEAGIGISVLPRRVVEQWLQKKSLATFSIRGIELKHQFKVIYHKNKYLSPVMQDFIKIAEAFSGKNE